MLADRVNRTLHETAGSLGGDTEVFADLAVRALTAVAETKALLDRVLGAGIEDVKQAGDHLHFGIRHDLNLGARVGVGEKINQFVGIVIADGAVEAGGGGQPVQTGVLVVEFVAVAGHGAQCGPEAGGTVAGKANKRGLLIKGTTDGLADPERGVGRELEALAPVELVDSVLKAEVAFLMRSSSSMPGGRG